MSRLSIVAVALLALAVGGCDDEVQPTLGIDAPFSLYGYLDPTADRQAIRVAAITPTLNDSSAFDGALVSTDLESGEQTTWRDSLVTYVDGTTGHVFVADFSPRPGTRVRLEASRSDGQSTTVEVDVPPIIEAEVGTETSQPGEIVYPIRFEGAPRVLNGQLRLTVTGFPGEDATLARSITIPFQGQPVEVSPDVWVVEVPFLSATRRYLVEEGLLGSGLQLVVADYVGFVTDESWVLPTTDPDALVEPGTFSNVESGFGFVGGGYFTRARWLPSPSAQAAAGFTGGGDPAEAIAINEVKTGAGGWVEFYNPLFSDVRLDGYSITNDQNAPRLQTFPFGVVVPARGFLVVPLQFDLAQGGAIALFDRASTQISRLPTRRVAGDAGDVTFGSYPDGASFQLPSGGPNIFIGPLAGTPGAPNELGLDVATINEVYTEGTGGYVEVVALDPAFEASGPLVFDEQEAYFDAVAVASLSFGVAEEAPGTFDLVQRGGEAYLLVTYFEPRILEITPGDPPQGGQQIRVFLTRVVDVRTYAPQVAGRADGRLPDRTGPWTTDLRPTRGAPNAAARVGL